MTCAVSPVCLSWTLLFLCVLVSAATDQTKNITAVAGQTVPLPCQAPRDKNIIVVEWSRPGLKPEYVFLYQDGRSDKSHQLPSFQNRVELGDRQMKDGDVSLTLKNVTVKDAGRYECYVVQGGRNRRRRANLNTEPISIINLDVQSGITEERGDDEGGDKQGNSRGRVGLGVGLSAAAPLVVVVVVVGFMIYRKRRGLTEQSSYKPPADAAADQQLA